MKSPDDDLDVEKWESRELGADPRYLRKSGYSKRPPNPQTMRKSYDFSAKGSKVFYRGSALAYEAPALIFDLLGAFVAEEDGIKRAVLFLNLELGLGEFCEILLLERDGKTWKIDEIARIGFDYLLTGSIVKLIGERLDLGEWVVEIAPELLFVVRYRPKGQWTLSTLPTMSYICYSPYFLFPKRRKIKVIHSHP